MKTKQAFIKSVFLFGLGAAVIGLSLLAFGATAGGVDAIKETTKPREQIKTYDGIQNLTINQATSLVIKSGDVKDTTVTYFDGSKFTNDVTLKQDGDTLTITQAYPDYTISGFMEAGGYALNARRQDYESVVVTIPKGTKLDTISVVSNNGYLHVDGLEMDKVDMLGNVSFSHVTIHSGDVVGGSVFINDSTLTNLAISGTTDVVKSTLDNVNFTNFSAGLSTEESILKNVTVENSTAADEEALRALEAGGDEANYYSYETAYDNFYPTYLSFGSKTQLDNVTFTGVGTLEFTDVSLKGDVSISGPFVEVTVNDSDQALPQTNISLTTTDGTLSVASQLGELEKDGKAFEKTVANPTSRLTIDTDHGKVNLK